MNFVPCEIQERALKSSTIFYHLIKRRLNNKPRSRLRVTQPLAGNAPVEYARPVESPKGFPTSREIPQGKHSTGQAEGPSEIAKGISRGKHSAWYIAKRAI